MLPTLLRATPGIQRLLIIVDWIKGTVRIFTQRGGKDVRKWVEKASTVSQVMRVKQRLPV